MPNLESIGTKIRNLRENSRIPLRKLAALLDIDQSTLSKIERDERRPNVQMVELIAKIFKADKKLLFITFYSDLVSDEIREEASFSEILKVAKAKIKNQRIKTQTSK